MDGIINTTPRRVWRDGIMVATWRDQTASLYARVMTPKRVYRASIWWALNGFRRYGRG